MPVYQYYQLDDDWVSAATCIPYERLASSLQYQDWCRRCVVSSPGVVQVVKYSREGALQEARRRGEPWRAVNPVTPVWSLELALSVVFLMIIDVTASKGMLAPPWSVEKVRWVRGWLSSSGLSLNQSSHWCLLHNTTVIIYWDNHVSRWL